MANRIFIIPRRTDFPGMNIAVWDLWPNNPQKNNELDGEGQTCYLGSCLDLPGATVRNGDAYMSGSTNTLMIQNIDAAVAMDTTGLGNDVTATSTACFGLSAYLRERVKDGVGKTPLSIANAMRMANAIRTAAEAGGALTVAAIDVLLGAIRLGTALNTNGSFGTVEDVLRILSGEVYRSPRYVILADNKVNFWLPLAHRNFLVAAQLTGTTGLTFSSHGGFLTSLEAGYRGRPVLARTGHANLSMADGTLHAYSHAMTFLNPSFAYAAADVTADRPRASDIAGNAIPATGVHFGVRGYLHTNQAATAGTCLL
jgi:hypothetical protein